MAQRKHTEVESLALEMAFEARRTITTHHPLVLYRVPKNICINDFGETSGEEGEPRQAQVEVKFEFYGANIKPVLCTCILHHDNELNRWVPKMVLGEYGNKELVVEFTFMGEVITPHVREEYENIFNRRN